MTPTAAVATAHQDPPRPNGHGGRGGDQDQRPPAAQPSGGGHRASGIGPGRLVQAGNGREPGVKRGLQRVSSGSSGSEMAPRVLDGQSGVGAVVVAQPPGGQLCHRSYTYF